MTAQTAIEKMQMPAIYVQQLTRAFASPADVLEGTGLSLQMLNAPAAHMSVCDMLQCVSNAVRIAPDPGWYQEWALRVAEHFHGPLTPAWLSAPTLGDGLDTFVRYFPARIPYMDMRSVIDTDSSRVELRPLAAFGDLLPLLVEIPLLIVQQYIGTLRSCRMEDAVIELTYEAPTWAASYARYFECAVSFGKPRNALVIPACWRTVANLGYDETTWSSSLRRCEQEDPTSTPSDILRRVHLELQSSLDADNPHAPLPTLDDIATALHVSTRTLIRRLRTLETTFQQERDLVRQRYARHLLDGDLYRINEIAAMLKFNDPTNFAKAFKRWFGESPSSYRDKIRA